MHRIATDDAARKLQEEGGIRYELSIYCTYLDKAAENLGIEPTYEAFVAYAEENPLFSFRGD